MTMHMGKDVKIYAVIKLPSPYNDYLFTNLHNHEGVILTVYYLWRQSWRHPWTVELATGYPRTYVRTFLGIDWSLFSTAVKDRESFFLVADWAHLPIIVVLLTRIAMHAPVAIWNDTPQEHLPRPLLKRILRRWFLAWLLRNVDVVFGTGKPALRELEKMGAPWGKLVNLPYYVDIQRRDLVSRSRALEARRQSFKDMVGCAKEGTVFLMAGTLEPRKGQEIGIRAFAQLHNAVGEPVGLIVAGDGPMRKDLEALALKLGVSDRVAFVGWLNPNDMDAAYFACDVVLHTPRWDPFPLIVLEGMSWGKVVIGSDVCGSVEDRIVHGFNGFAFPSGDISALVEIMQYVVSHPEEMQEIGLEARKTAEQWPVERGVETIVASARNILWYGHLLR